MITIHEAGAAGFDTLGLGALTPTECMIDERAGGLYELKLVHPVTDDYRHTLLAQYRIIKAPAPVRETPLLELGQSGSVTREIYRVATGGARLNMRAAPNGKIMHAYPPGTEAVKIGQSDDGTWLQVALMDGGATGWMFAEYLELIRTETEAVVGDTPGIVQPRQTREQLFRIIDTEPDSKLRTVTAWAQHITYDLKGAIVVGEYEPDGVAADVVCAQLMARADHDVSDFHIYCAVDGKITGSYGGRNIIDCLLDPETGVAAQTGARVVRDNYDIFLLPDEERERGVELRYGKNLLSAAMTTSVADVITRIRPVGKDAEGGKLYIEDNNGFVDSTRIDEYPVIYSKEIEYDVAVSDELPVNEAREQLKSKAQADFDAGCDLAGVTLNVDFIRVELTEKYKHLASAYALHMYDRVPVIDRDAGIVATVRMIGYRYDGLLDRYDKTILGDIGDVETTVQGYEIAPGSVSGTKIVPNSMSGDRLRNLSVGYGKFNAAAIGQLAADAITAVRADIRKLVAGEITTDQLYADLAEIAIAQITTANIQNAKIEWAKIANLTAEIAKIANAQIGTATINYAKIVDAALGTAIITEGVGGKLLINRLAVTEANMVSLTVGALMVKAEDGSFKQLVVGSDGNVTGKTVEVEGDNIAAATIPGGKLIENTITARELNVGSIFADEALIRAIKAANIDVADLFAAKATITELDSWLISTSVIQGLNDQLILVAGRTVGGTNLISSAEGNIWVLTGGVNYNWGKSISCQSGVAAMMLAWSGSHNEVDYESDIDLEPGVYTLSFWSWYASLTVAAVIRPNILGSGYDQYFDDYAFVPNPGVPMRYSFPLEINYTGRAKLRFVTMTPWTVGEVYFTDVKLERGNTATEWSPHPGDPAGELDTGTGGGVQVTITKDRFNVNVPGEDGDFELNETGGVLPVLRSKYVESPNLAYAYDGPATITVKPDATSDEIAAGGVYKSLPEALAALNNRQLAYDVTINVVGDSYGDVELRGVLGGYAVYVYGGKHALYGHMDISGCQASVKIYSLSVIRTSSAATTACTLNNCADIMFFGCTFDANDGNDALWIGQAVRAFIRECAFYNAVYTLIGAAYGADVTINNAIGGNAANFAYTDGVTIKWGGTRPDGVWSVGNPSLTSPSDLSTLTVNSGEATPTVPTITTAEYPMQHADSYAGGFENSWDYQGHDDIMQGYTEHAGRIYGCIWFDNAAIRTAVAGKTVKQATIRLTAQRYVGRGVAVEVHLYGTTTEYAGRNGPPVLVNYEGGGYGVIGTATPGETTTISIPIDAAADLASGAINGLVLYSDDETLYGNRNYSRNYMRFDGSTSGDASTRPVLTVVYE